MKRFLIAIIIIILVTTILCSCSSSSSEETSGVGPSGISLDEFNQLSLGELRYDKACSIIGGKGELKSKTEYEEENRTRYVSIYRFEGEKSGYAELEFTVYGYKDLFDVDMNQYLTSKNQFNLK